MNSIKLISVLAAIGFGIYGQAQTPPLIRQRIRPTTPGQRESRERLPWSEAAGRPNINFGRAVGIYVWHEGNRVHILSADDKRNGQITHGTITLRGPEARIVDVDRIKDEKNDHVGKHGDTVHFRLDTYTAEDGFKFSIQGGKALVIDVDQPGNRDRNVYVGGSQIAANRGIVVFDLSK